MDLPQFKFPASPGTPLFPLSPERVNGSRPPYSGSLSGSPSAPEFGKPSMGVDPFVFGSKSKSPFRHSRNNSDALVHGMVARFDSMTIKDFRSRDEIAIKRADMAREMAEMESKKLKEEANTRDAEMKKAKEELRKMKKDLEETRERERKTVKRLDVVMDDLSRSKETHSHAVGVYEKEIRRARKEAFKSSSSLVKLQEESKAMRSSLKVGQSALESEKLKSSKREQEAFRAQYQLVGMQEEFQKALERLKVLEAERDGLKTSLKEEEVGRIAAEGRIALPVTAENDDDDLLATPVKLTWISAFSDSDNKENIVPRKAIELKSLQEELVMERRLRVKAEDQVEFMKMECQFQCCSCRVAELSGNRYVHDDSFSFEMEKIKMSVPQQDKPKYEDTIEEENNATEVDHDTTQVVRRRISYSPALGTFQGMSDTKADTMEIDSAAENARQETPDDTNTVEIDESEPIDNELVDDSNHGQDAEPFVQESDEEVAVVELVQESVQESVQEPEQEPVQEPEQDPAEDVEDVQDHHHPPRTPQHREVRTITTTTTVPIMFSPLAPNPEQPMTPMTVGHAPLSQISASPFSSNAFKPDGTLDREAALELIRQRRGRARSVAMGYATPKKQMIEGSARRDVSAPTLRAGSKR